jgi:hypothetical protein
VEQHHHRPRSRSGPVIVLVVATIGLLVTAANAESGAEVAQSPLLAVSLAGVATAFHLARDRRDR